MSMIKQKQKCMYVQKRNIGLGGNSGELEHAFSGVNSLSVTWL